VIRGGLRQKVDDDRADAGLQHGLLSFHLLDGERRFEELGESRLGRRGRRRRSGCRSPGGCCALTGLKPCAIRKLNPAATKNFRGITGSIYNRHVRASTYD
jgi:hypothetical protein